MVSKMILRSLSISAVKIFFAVFNYKYRVCMKIAGAMFGMNDFSVVCHW